MPKTWICSGIKDEFGEKISFHGGVDIMRTLPKGKPEQVQAEVRNRGLIFLAKAAATFCCSSHHIQPDTPIANVIANVRPETSQPYQIGQAFRAALAHLETPAPPRETRRGGPSGACKLRATGRRPASRKSG